MVTAREIVAVFGGGDILPDGNVLVAAPNHARRDRSLSILPLPDGRVLVNTFSPRDDRLTLLRYVEDKLGIDPIRSATKPSLIDRTKVRALQAQVEEEHGARQKVKRGP